MEGGAKTAVVEGDHGSQFFWGASGFNLLRIDNNIGHSDIFYLPEQAEHRLVTRPVLIWVERPQLGRSFLADSGRLCILPSLTNSPSCYIMAPRLSFRVKLSPTQQENVLLPTSTMMSFALAGTLALEDKLSRKSQESSFHSSNIKKTKLSLFQRCSYTRYEFNVDCVWNADPLNMLDLGSRF